jgi:hypothetical protein
MTRTRSSRFRNHQSRNEVNYTRKTYNEGTALFLVCTLQQTHGVQNLNPCVAIKENRGIIVPAWERKTSIPPEKTQLSLFMVLTQLPEPHGQLRFGT